MKTSTTQVVDSFLTACKKYGYTFKVKSDTCIAIEKEFTPGDMDAYVKCDTTYYSVLGLIPMTSPGSMWGSDGGSVGGFVSHKNGYFVMNRSGCSKRVLSALKKAK